MSDEKIKCVNPATLNPFAEVEITPPSKVIEYATKARAAFPIWNRLSFEARAKYLLRAREYLLDNIDSFAEAITLDNGKPLLESITAEIYPIADLIYYFAKNSERILKNKRVCLGIWHLLGRSSSLKYQPYGVIGIISPWNYPFSIPVGAVVMALMAGNCVLLKPSSATAFVGKKIEELFKAISLPEFTFTHIPGTAKTGQALLESPIDKIIFTGSTDVGHHIMEFCSKKIMPLSLELGGKDPMIVMPDANLEHAASGAVWGAFTNAGQCCASIERVYVHESIADEFIERVRKKTVALKVGPGNDPSSDIGPLTTEAQLKTVKQHVADAVKNGANILTGGQQPKDLKGWFFEPTIITDIDHSVACVHEETFGPLMPIMKYQTEEQVIKWANDTPYGLNAYIWTGNIRAGKRLSTKLKCGTVAINEAVYTHALSQTPWGGRGASGFGRTHGEAGLKEYVNLQHIHINRCTHFKDIWWYKYSAELLSVFKNLSRTMTGGIAGKIRSMPLFIQTLLKKR